MPRFTEDGPRVNASVRIRAGLVPHNRLKDAQLRDNRFTRTRAALQQASYTTKRHIDPRATSTQ